VAASITNSAQAETGAVAAPAPYRLPETSWWAPRNAPKGGWHMT
jgi:hypothetical protein